MKKLLVALIVAVALLASCYTGPNPPVQYVQQPVAVQQPQYQIIQDPNTGMQQVVFYDGGQQMIMDYILFNQLMGNGGYNNVITYYHRTPSIRHIYEPRTYSRWKTVNTTPSTWSSGTKSSGYSSPSSNNSTSRSSGWSTKPSATTVSPSSGYSSPGVTRPAYAPSKPSGYSSFKSVTSSPKSSGYSTKSSSSSSSKSSGYSSRRH